MENNKVIKTQNDEEEEDVLSLCDLPDEKDDNTPPLETQQDDPDFIFCSLAKEPEMCAADDVFYQGRILPYCDINSRSVSSSEDHFSSGGRFSSRSSSSGGGGEQTGTRFSAANKQRTGRLNARKKSSAWDIFRRGLMISQPAEVDFQDLKNRYQRNSKNWGEKKKKKEEEKKKRRSYNCRCCSSDAVDAKVVVIKRSAAVRDGRSEQVVVAVVDDDEKLLPKKRLDDNPTFQWF